MALTPKQTREVLASLGISPRRSLGQNFLVDGNIVRKSLALAQITPGDRVVEVGPGLGTLTESLLESGAEVWAVERDPVLHRHLAESLGARHPQRLHLLFADAVEAPLAGLPAEEARNFKAVANLPYAISTPWMDAVLSGPLPTRMVLMLQKEAASRYVAAADTGDFGAISIFLQSSFEVEPGHPVSPACFHPRPDVESVLLNLVRKQQPWVFTTDQKLLIRRCFEQRRKQLGSVLRNRMPEHHARWLAILAEAGLAPSVRAEAVPVEVWRALAAEVRPG